MKTIFVHDHILIKKNGKYYTTGGLSDTITSRYTDVFGSLNIICRGKEDSNSFNVNLEQIKNNKISIKTLKTNIFNTKILKFLKSEIDSSDKIIIRLPSLLGIYAGLLSVITGKNYLVEVVGNAFESYWYKSIFGKLFAIPYHCINRYIVMHAKYVLYVSNDYLQHKYPNNNRSIGCSDVILNETNQDVLNNRIKRIKLFNKKNRLVIGTLANFNQKYKGHETVFKAIRFLKNKGYNIEYRLAGSGYKYMLEKLIEKYNLKNEIFIYGLIKHKDINNWLDDLDIYIQPSLTEGIPRSLIEAISRGCPSIVSNAGGMYELLDREYVFKKNNYKQLISILESIQKEELFNMAKTNYKKSKKYQDNYLNNIRKDFFYEYLDEK